MTTSFFLSWLLNELNERPRNYIYDLWNREGARRREEELNSSKFNRLFWCDGFKWFMQIPLNTLNRLKLVFRLHSILWAITIEACLRWSNFFDFYITSNRIKRILLVQIKNWNKRVSHNHPSLSLFSMSIRDSLI